MIAQGVAYEVLGRKQFVGKEESEGRCKQTLAPTSDLFTSCTTWMSRKRNGRVCKALYMRIRHVLQVLD